MLPLFLLYLITGNNSNQNMMNMNQSPGTVNATTCKIKNLIVNIIK